MGLFHVFRKKKVQLTEEQLKWNKMWELWTEGQANPPYAELMTYQSEVNNGGHVQYFDNLENRGDLQMEMSVLKTILPSKLVEVLEEAHRAYLVSEEDEEGAEEILSRCDELFYENEQEINRILEGYAAKMEL